MNAIRILCPYRFAGQWVFDDPAVNLAREPFVAGIDKILDRLVADIPSAGNGFRLIFSSGSFPGSSLRLDWLRKEGGGNWYRCDEYQLEGWLCPALYKYFEQAPQTLFAQALPIEPQAG